ncbi:MAG: immunity 49 family protein [Kofleriaceae bacterium]
MRDLVELQGQAALGAALVARALPGQVVEVTVARETLQVTREGGVVIGSIVEYADAWAAAVVARDTLTERGLREVSLTLLANSKAVTDLYQVELRDALQCVVSDPPRCLASVGRGRDLLKQATIAKKPLLVIDGALFDAIEALASNATTAFEDHLYESLKAHAKFWGSKAEAIGPYGWVAMRQLALTCIARDRGIEIAIESEYLPRALIEQTCSNEPRLYE